MIRIGSKLQEERLRRGLSLESIEHDTKIKATFLAAIEKGNYHHLPTGAHVSGFVGRYAEYLGFDKNESLAVFRREFNTDSAFSVLPKSISNERDFRTKKRFLSQNGLLIISVVVILLGYVIFQYKDALLNPPLAITAPLENQTITTQTITVSGKTDANATVMIRNEQVPVDASGTFEKTLVVFPGETVLQVTSKNRFGKISKTERHIKVISGY